MNIEGCEIPDDLYYDVENDIWVRGVGENLYQVGLTLPFFYRVGRPTRIKPRPVGSSIKKGSSLATVETPNYVGALYSPFNCEITSINENIVENIVKNPYKTWVVQLRAVENPLDSGLLAGEEAKAIYEEKLRTGKVACFKTFPEHKIIVLAETCEKILTIVGDYFFKHVKKGESLYVVTQDPATEADMIKWAKDMKQEVLEIRRQDNIIHVLYRKVT